MNWEFQILYREMQAPNFKVPAGSPQTINVISHNKDEAKAMLENGGFQVLGVTEIRAVVDWEKPVWDLDEFAAAMNLRGKTLSTKKGDGKTPWSHIAGGVPRRVAMAWIEKGLNPAGKEILDELKAA